MCASMLTFEDTELQVRALELIRKLFHRNSIAQPRQNRRPPSSTCVNP